MDHNEQLDRIESVMDSVRLIPDFIDVIAEVFSAKADHIRENWQDSHTAHIYDLYAAAILNTPEQVDKELRTNANHKG